MSAFNRGPLNDPMSPEATPRSDRFVYEGSPQQIIEDRHFDEFLYEEYGKKNQLTEAEVADLAWRQMFTKIY